MSNLIKPRDLTVGTLFHLTGDAENPAERDLKHTIFRVVKVRQQGLFTHALLEDTSTLKCTEATLAPWVPLVKVTDP
jgi:hypothetical protein